MSLAWRDIRVRYKQSLLGIAWAVLLPLSLMLVFTFVFTRAIDATAVLNLDMPYALYAYTGLVPWTFFANGLTQSANSLVGSQNLIKKIYFPRLVIPVSTVMSGAVDFILAFTVLLGMMLFYHIAPTANVVWLPAFLALAFVTSLAVGLWFSALNVQFRDVRFTVPFIV